MDRSLTCQRLDDCGNGRFKRWILLFAALIELFFFGGYHYGYNALIEPYTNISVFHERCNQTETTCTAQVQMFNYASIVWVVLQMCLITGAGMIMDRLGLRLLKLIAAGLYFIGSVMFALTKENTSWLLFPAGVFVALGSTSTLICNHQISSKFPRFRGFAISLMSGAFDSSTVVTFLIAKTFPQISLQTSFLVIAGCSLVYGTAMALFGLTQWSVSMGLKDDTDDRQEMGEGVDEEHNAAEKADLRIQRVLETRFSTLGRCLKSVPFFLVTLWFMFGLLRFSYFLNQMGQELKYRFGDDQETIDELWPVSSALLMAGFVISPLTGLILDTSRAMARRKIINKMKNASKMPPTDEEVYRLHLCGIAPAFFIMAVAATATSLLNFSKTKIAFYASFGFFVLLRSLLFSASVGFVLIAFPIQHFGTVNGIVNSVGGLFSLITYGLLELDAVTGNALGVGISIVLFVSPLIIFCGRCIPLVRNT